MVFPASRQVLATVGAVSLAGAAGCSVVNRTTPPAVETPRPGDCSATEPPRPTAPGEGLPDPLSYPTGPPSLERSAVVEYVRAYERAYVHNQVLADAVAGDNCLRSLDASVSETTSSRAGAGFVVEASRGGGFAGADCPGATSTGSPLPTAHLGGVASYHVTERFLAREGVVVECW